MGAEKEIVKQQTRDLKDYTDTIAAVHLFKEVITNGAVVTVGAAKQQIEIENDQNEPKIGNVVKAILAKAGTPGEHESKWVEGADGWHLEAAITVGGAVYTVDIVLDEVTSETEQKYTVNITSKLVDNVERGKLFFDPAHAAKIKLVYKDGHAHAVTHKGLAVTNGSFIPHAYQNEIMAKFYDSLKAGKEQRLAIMGTGSGKSIVMAGIAQAVGRTVMIVPDKTLVDQQARETRALLGAGIVHGVKQTPPNVFTLDTFKDKLEIDWEEELTEEGILQIKTYFRKVLANEAEDTFDQIVLQAENPLFKIIAPEIKDSMVLIDESHRHTFKKEDAKLLQGLQEKNTVLALTATPTSQLYELFADAPLDDLSLGAAIQLGTIRPIKPEWGFFEENKLVDQAVVHYFDDYYLTEGMSGYVDPVQLKEQIKLKNSGIVDHEAEKRAIDQALELNRIRGQRNMGFSDNKKTREDLATAYQNLANGDAHTIEKYQDQVAKFRQESEIQARLQLARKFNSEAKETEVQEQVPLRPVDLKGDIAKEQQKDIQRTINSYALALVFNEKPADLAEKDRTHKLNDYLKKYDEYIVKYKKEEAEPIPPPYLPRFQSCETKDRSKLALALTSMGPPISKLPTHQKDLIVGLILDRAEAMATNVRASTPISALVTNALPVDLNGLKATENYASAIDISTEQSKIDEQLAQIEVGLKTHIVADQVIATGVSIKDILNVQIINTHSPVVETDINVINGILSGPQATGRCVRHSDVSARAQQYIDKRYQDKDLILTVSDVIDAKDSATKTRIVMDRREEQAHKEGKAATTLQKWIRGFQTRSLFKKYEPLEKEIQKHQKELENLDELIEDKQKCIETKKQELKSREHEFNLELALGEDAVKKVKAGKKLPPEYARNPTLYLSWVKVTLDASELRLETSEVRQTYKELVDEIKGLEKNEKELQDLKKEAFSALKNLKEAPEKVRLERELEKKSTGPSQF